MQKTKKIYSIALILLLVVSMSSVLALRNERVVATQNQLQNQYRSQYQVSSGEFIDVEVTKEQAKTQARQQIREKLKIQNCSCENIQIVEIKNSQNQNRIAYQIIEEQEGKIFGLFRKKVRVQVNMDVETGEIINIKRPWYMWMMRFGSD